MQSNTNNTNTILLTNRINNQHFERTSRVKYILTVRNKQKTKQKQYETKIRYKNKREFIREKKYLSIKSKILKEIKNKLSIKSCGFKVNYYDSMKNKQINKYHLLEQTA